MQIGVDSGRSVENKRIFVVDHDEITRAAVQFMLHDENETHDLVSLEAAWEKSQNWKPDLLILGVSILEQRGIEVIDPWRQRLPGLSVLLICSPSELPFGLTCLKYGANDVVVKPLVIEVVRGKVNALLGR